MTVILPGVPAAAPSTSSTTGTGPAVSSDTGARRFAGLLAQLTPGRAPVTGRANGAMGDAPVDSETLSGTDSPDGRDRLKALAHGVIAVAAGDGGSNGSASQEAVPELHLASAERHAGEATVGRSTDTDAIDGANTQSDEDSFSTRSGSVSASDDAEPLSADNQDEEALASEAIRDLAGMHASADRSNSDRTSAPREPGRHSAISGAPTSADRFGEDAAANLAAGRRAGSGTSVSAAADPSLLAARDAAIARITHANGRVDPNEIIRSAEVLHPEFKVRLERVIDRMESEHGHQVELVETLRHQVRQNHLFEQGRSRPGDVVTWTRASKHTMGVAADVIIDGTYSNSAAYARLHAIAAEEGLRTLGPSDAGHLELPNVGSDDPQFAAVGADSESESPDNSAAERAASSRKGNREGPDVRGIARPAAVARVADLASPRVAAVARVAVPGREPALDDSSERSTTAAGPMDVAPTRSTGSAAEAVRSDAGFALLEGGRLSAGAQSQVTAGITSTSAERLAHLLDLDSSAPLRPLSQVVLRVDGPGGVDRIRLDLRGSTLDGTIDLSDAAAAEKLDARIGELQRALESRGLEAQNLRVRASTPVDAVEISRGALAALDLEGARGTGSRSSPDTDSQRQRSPSDPHGQDDARNGSSDSRQRSRREPGGGHRS